MGSQSARKPFARLMATLAIALSLGACDGENLFRDPAGAASKDKSIPLATIVAPDSNLRIAVGDSVLVQVHVEDDLGITGVELSGFAIRGSTELGTETRVERFEPRTVDLSAVRPEVRDTVIARYLRATDETLVEDRVFVVAMVTDVGGNVTSDTLPVRIGGPRIQILGPPSGSDVRAGTNLKVRLSAGDPEHSFHNLRLFATGAVTGEIELRFEPPRVSLDTIVNLPIPSTLNSGEIRLHATIRNTVNDTSASQPVLLKVLPPLQDTRAPLVRFSATTPTRAERTDSISVTVVGVDDTQIGLVGARIIPISRTAFATDTLNIVTVTAAADSATFRIPLTQLGVPIPTDTSTLRLEVTAFAVDTAGNCATATVPNTPLTELCVGANAGVGVRPGARFELLVVRGQTVPLATPGDRIADLVADDQNVFLSNITRNRLEVLPIGGTTFSTPVSVGSRPWGLAFNRNKSLLYVANSGGTNISVVSPVQRAEVQRIQTPNVKLFDVTFDAKLIPNPDTLALPDSLEILVPSTVVRYDYSDRPQSIGITQNENIVFSTVPTAAASDGTVRVYRTGQARLEIVTEYAEERVANKVVIVNADSAFLVVGSPNNSIQVCPRNRSANPLKDGQLEERCYVGPVNWVETTITGLGYDTKFLYNLNIDEIGLADTTFVAVSGDHSTVAVGEGATSNGRVVSLTDPAGQANHPFVRHGEVRDLVGNTAERLIGLSLNRDGSLGLARGREAFFFSRELRLQGIVETDAGGGGADMHLDNPSVQRAFVSGVTADGLAFVDVMDTFHFRRLGRIFLRDAITGPVRAVRTPQGGLKIYAVTQRGIVAVDVIANDL